MSNDHHRTAILAGGGTLPEKVYQACKEQGRNPYVIGFNGQASPDFADMMVNIGAAGKIIKSLHKHEIRDVIFVGDINRPSLASLKPDFRGAKILTKVGFKSLGDDALLKLITNELEGEGFRVIGAHEVLQDVLAPKGVWTKAEPDAQAKADIERGMEVAKLIGSADIGQAVIVQQGVILAVEAAEGTDEMLKRAAALKKEGAGGVLVKIRKPQQDKRLDLPTVGPQTIENAGDAGLRGVAILADETLIVDRDKMIELADNKGLFIVAL